MPFTAVMRGCAAACAGAMNTPFACTRVGVERFSADAAVYAVVYVAIACCLAYLFSGHARIDRSPRITTPPGATVPDTVEPGTELSLRRWQWETNFNGRTCVLSQLGCCCALRVASTATTASGVPRLGRRVVRHLARVRLGIFRPRHTGVT